MMNFILIMGFSTSSAKQLKADGRHAEANEINKQMWIIRKKSFTPPMKSMSNMPGEFQSSLSLNC